MTKIIAIVLLLVGIGSAGTYAYLNPDKVQQFLPFLKSNQTSSQQPQQTDKYAGWKTYTNARFGISIKYPPSFVLNEGEIVSNPAEKSGYSGEIFRIQKVSEFISLSVNRGASGFCYDETTGTQSAEVSKQSITLGGGIEAIREDCPASNSGSRAVLVYFNVGLDYFDLLSSGLVNISEVEVNQIIDSLTVTK